MCVVTVNVECFILVCSVFESLVQTYICTSKYNDLSGYLIRHIIGINLIILFNVQCVTCVFFVCGCVCVILLNVCVFVCPIFWCVLLIYMKCSHIVRLSLLICDCIHVHCFPVCCACSCVYCSFLYSQLL